MFACDVARVERGGWSSCEAADGISAVPNQVASQCWVCSIERSIVQKRVHRPRKSEITQRHAAALRQLCISLSSLSPSVILAVGLGAEAGASGAVRGEAR